MTAAPAVLDHPTTEPGTHAPDDLQVTHTPVAPTTVAATTTTAPTAADTTTAPTAAADTTTAADRRPVDRTVDAASLGARFTRAAVQLRTASVRVERARAADRCTDAHVEELRARARDLRAITAALLRDLG